MESLDKNGRLNLTKTSERIELMNLRWMSPNIKDLGPFTVKCVIWLKHMAEFSRSFRFLWIWFDGGTCPLHWSETTFGFLRMRQIQMCLKKRPKKFLKYLTINNVEMEIFIQTQLEPEQLHIKQKSVLCSPQIKFKWPFFGLKNEIRILRKKRLRLLKNNSMFEIYSYFVRWYIN